MTDTNLYQKAVNRVNNTIQVITNEITKSICSAYWKSELKNKSQSTIISTAYYYNKLFRNLLNADLDSVSDEYIYDLLLQKQAFSSVAFRFFSKIYNENLLSLFKDNHYKYQYLNNFADYNLVKSFKDGLTKPEYVIYVSNTNQSKERQLKFIPSKSSLYISSLIASFLSTTKTSALSFSFPSAMAEFLFDRNISDIKLQITDKLVEEYFDLNRDKDSFFFSNSKYFFIWVLTQLSEEQQLKQCPLYRISVLSKTTFINHFKQGYRPVLFNVFDDVPKENKWLIIPNGAQKRSTELTDQSVISADFSVIKNPLVREFEKQRVWYGSSSINTLVKEMKNIVTALNMVFPDEQYEYKSIDAKQCAAYKSWVLSAYPVTETRNAKIYPFLSFVKYVEKNKLLSVDKNCYLYLKNKGALNQRGAKGIPKEDLIKIANYLESHKTDSIQWLESYVIFHICLNTEFRISQILNLKVDCVHESLKKGEYVIKSITKVSGYKEIEQPCAKIVKNIIDDYLNVSSEFRQECQDHKIKDHLFILKDLYKGTFYYFSRQLFSESMNKVCVNLGINSYTAKNLRSTYITNAKEYVIKNKLSDMTLLGITGHRNVNTINNHYIQEKIRDALQATNNVIIGNVNINGTIVKDNSSIKTGKELTVENGCGYCQSKSCELSGPLSCLLCKHFATTVDRLPYFRKQIDFLDENIKKATNKHDLEDAVNLKRLFLRYEEALISIKEEKNADC